MTESTKELAEKLDIGVNELNSMVHRTDYYYRTFFIPKRKSGYREINVPHVSLLNVQRRISKLFFHDEFIESPATAYRPNISIVDNARAHLGAQHLLKLDLENFFGNIKFGRVLRLFESVVRNQEFALPFTQLVTFNRALPQGAATSPVISNMVSRNLDKRLLGVAHAIESTYTRYSDDLTFSGQKRFSNENLSEINNIVETEGFKLNQTKIQFVSTHKKIVTGISIHDNKLNLTKSFRRQLKAEIHKLHRGIQQFGLTSIEDPVIFERLNGKLNFWHQVVPESPQLLKLREVLRTAHTNFEVLLNER